MLEFISKAFCEINVCNVQNGFNNHAVIANIFAVSSVSSQETLDSIVIKGGTAHLWCHFQASNSSLHVPQRKMIYTSKFRPAIAQDVLIWAGPQVPANDSNRRLRMRYILNELSVNMTRVQYNDAGTYSCIDEDDRIIMSHNLIVTGEFEIISFSILGF